MALRIDFLLLIKIDILLIGIVRFSKALNLVSQFRNNFLYFVNSIYYNDIIIVIVF